MKYIKTAICIAGFFFLKSAQAQEKLWYEKDGIYLGLGTGTWMPTNNENPLKTPIFISFNTDLKSKKNSFGFSFDLLFLKTKEPLSVRYKDQIINDKTSYAGVNITFNYGREFYQNNRFSFEAITGLGHGEISFYNPSAEIDVSKGSFLVNPGISTRYLMKNNYFLQFKLQYNIANYHEINKVDNNLKGQYITAKVIFGTCIN
jgi:hypothetical protein